MHQKTRLVGHARRALSMLLFSIASTTFAGVLTGSLADSAGQPLAGAIISLTDSRGITESVYSDATGSFRLTTDMKGKLQLRARKRYHEDLLRPITLTRDSHTQLKLELVTLTDPKRISDDAPSLSHFAKIKFDKVETAPFSRANFTRDCVGCHSVGNATTRFPRLAEGWLPTLERMYHYVGKPDLVLMRERAALLARAFDGSPVTSKTEVPFDPLLARARIKEWRLDGAEVPHDAEVHRGNGKVYSSDMFAGKIIEIDLESGKITRFQESADGSPPGGNFTKLGLPAPYGLTVSRAPHSLAEGPDGKFYLTDSIGGAIGVFDPKTKKFKHYDIGGGAIYPHTIRFDKEGIAWFTISATNQVGRFDPRTKAMKVLTLPNSKMLGFYGGQVAYGIDVNPKDGSIWYTQLNSDKIGRIDPKTFQIRDFDSPVRGPRRQRFDAEGKLWVVGFSEGAIARIDVESWQAKVFKLPQFTPGEVPAPYALAVHPQTQEIWVNDTMLDLVWRFIPKEERFVAYPLPLKGTYTRDFTFTKNGWACTANNPIPSGALEGGTPELICIDPGDVAAKGNPS